MKLSNGDKMFEFGEWAIRAEWPSDGPKGKIDSYIYHEPCRNTSQMDRDGGVTSGDSGWCSAWDVRAGKCYYCKKAIPDEPITVWLLLEGTKLGSYMNDSSEPWKALGGLK